MSKVFDKYAQYYDLLYQDKDYSGEVNYIDGLIKRHSPGAKTLLDLGCGTGKHDHFLSLAGYNVSGVDLSPEMIDLAKTKYSSSGCSFYTGDVRDVDLKQQFDIVISLFHVISYQTNNEDVVQMLQTAKKHLKPNGLFIFDFWYGPGVLTERPVKRTKLLENDSLVVSRLAEPIMYANRNVVDVNYAVTVTDKTSKENHTLHEKHPMRYFFMPELLHFLQSNKLKYLHDEEWITGKDMSFNTWNGVIICSND